MIKRFTVYLLLAAAVSGPLLANPPTATGKGDVRGSDGKRDAGKSSMLAAKSMMAQQQANALNQAIKDAAINPMDDTRRANLQNSINNAAAAKTALEAPFTSGSIGGGLGTVQNELSASVDPHAADRNNPNVKSQPQPEANLLDQLRTGSGSGSPTSLSSIPAGKPGVTGDGGGNGVGPNASSASSLSPAATANVEIKALQEIPKDQNTTDSKTSGDSGSQNVAAAKGAAQENISKLDELQSVLTNASEKSAKNSVGKNVTLIENGSKVSGSANTETNTKGAQQPQTEDHGLTPGYGPGLSARLAGFLMDSADGEGGRMGQLLSPVASLLEWAGLLGKTAEKSKGRHRPLFRYHFDASPAALVIPFLFFVFLIWAVLAVRAAVNKRRGGPVFAEELRRAA